MIKGMHGMFYTSEPEALRAFIRDKLRLSHADVGGGWLIFAFPEADLGCHPVDHPGAPPSGTHNLSFYCDDLRKTVSELRGRGVTFDDDVTDQGYGLTIHFTMPGDVQVELYQPHYAKPSAAPRRKAASRKKTSARKKAPPRKNATSRKPAARKAAGRKRVSRR